MAEQPTRGRAAREPTTDRSRGFSPSNGGFLALLRGSERFAAAVTVAAAIAGILMVATEFATVTWVDVADESCQVIASRDQRDRCRLSGFERHGGAVLLLGIAAVVMGWGAGVGASRPAALALVAVGAIVLAIGLLRDLPETGRTGAIGFAFADAKAKKGTGLYLELIGGALAIGAGAARLTVRRPGDRRQPA